ncbi:uracil-DNA glycosylase [Methylonatrum kenyense]|uniref:uracil-DNA glycosylase n=1 Tax=Methylonatrum kenyense TaxID=455253 RepID=UPI0020BECCF2|nr:uracil-DNA glycosylase [Methylonatrum kenyense]MCK8516098.1 uracil-DNA glycosylase [Methylonatrum kenyense]
MTVSARQALYLRRMGIDLWRQRDPAAAPAAPGARVVAGEPDRGLPDEQADDWTALQQRVSGCRLCDLCESRRQTVFGVGSPSADLLLIGEAPGAEEDRRGEPFVGAAGKLLDNMLRAIDLDRQRVFIANVLKCRPPNNRDPKPEEVRSCMPYLEAQIRHLQPRVILALGKVAAQSLLESGAPLKAMRERWHQLGPLQVPLLVTYHPAYLLRRPEDKAKAWRDLCRIRDRLGERT